MEKINTSTITAFILTVLCLFVLPAQAQYDGGTGDPCDPFQINDPCQLNTIGQYPNDWDKHFILTADIDLSAYTGEQFNIIGKDYPFTGSFDGNGHTVSNFTYIAISGGPIGLFGRVGDPCSCAVVKDLTLADPCIVAEAGSYSGSLIGWLENGIITGCGVEGGNVTGSSMVGGLVGLNMDMWMTGRGEISDCYTDCNVTGSSTLGGLVGYNCGNISGCHATGSVMGESCVGGLVGSNSDMMMTGDIEMSNCYAIGDVTGSSMVGGLVGHNSSCNISDCHADGSVTANGNYVGGLVGQNMDMTMTGGSVMSNCYAIGDVASNGESSSYVGGLVGQNWSCNISDCHADGSVTANGDYVGGLVGYNSDMSMTGGVEISGCYALGDVASNGDSSSYVGGLVGSNMSCNISDCHADGSVTANGNYVGGLVGHNMGMMMTGGGVISNCYAIGDVVSNGDSGSYIGGLVGGNTCDISDCYATGNVTSNGDNIGGLVGQNSGDISNCYAIGNITSNADNSINIGGLVGNNSNMMMGGIGISNCYATGNVTSNGDNSNGIGGLVGSNMVTSGVGISNCYATGNITSNGDNIGGLVGSDMTGGSIGISNCYAAGNVTGNGDNIGGLVGNGCYIDGYNSYSISFWNTDVNPGLTGVGNVDPDPCGVIGETTANMQIQSTFTNTGWDFVGETENGTNEIWQMPTGGGYPVLSNFNGYSPLPLAGDGTPENPYLIGDPNELGAIYHYDNSANYRLDGDIDLSGINWNAAPIPMFRGCFDGNGHTITALTIEGGRCLGLFGNVSDDGEIKELGMIDVSICGGAWSTLGGLVGQNSGSISNCYATGSICGGDNLWYIGGLVGTNGNMMMTGAGRISNCYATVSISVDLPMYLGGLVGMNHCGSINNCYATGNVNSSGNNTGSGLVAYNYGSVSNSFWDMETSGQTQSDGGFGRTTVQMKQSSTYNGWGDGVWTIEEGVDYPHLTWEGTGGTVMNNIPDRSYSGSGTQDDPFIMISADDIICLTGRQEDWNRNFELAGNIDMSAVTGYLPPGRFNGKFEGNGYCIINLTVNESTSQLGLFGRMESGGEINNLGMVNAIITGYRHLGGLVGWNSGGSISDCYATGSVSGGDSSWRLGGLCGYSYGSISNCYSTSSVTGGNNSYYIGGLMGYNSGNLNNCYANGSINGDDYIGGLMGYNSGNLNNCYATGSVTANGNYVGGLVGRNYYGDLNNCYAIGSVSGDNYLGGLVGYDYDGSGSYISSFWNSDVNPDLSGVGNLDPDPCEVIGETTANMQIQSTFTDEGWDFVGENVNGTNDIWRMCVDGIDYPKLSWQFLPGDFVCSDGVDLADFAVLAETWSLSSGQTGYNDLCDLIDDNTIDLNDLAVFAENWLRK